MSGTMISCAPSPCRSSLALQRLGDLGEQLGVFFNVLAAHDDERQGCRVGDVLGKLDAFLHGLVQAVGICTLEVQADAPQLRATAMSTSPPRSTA